MLDVLAHIHWGAVFQIVLIDILLGGDNAVVIALACRNLDRKRRLQGILWGTLGAIVLRLLLIIFALQLLSIPYLKIVGALLLFWIGVRLLLPESDEHGNIHTAGSVFAAIRTIIVADFVMSMDNAIAIAGAAQQAVPDHQAVYVMFGLLISVPIIIWGSTLVLKVIDRFPVIVLLGGGLLGWIAGGMLVTDEAMSRLLQSIPGPVESIAGFLGAVFVMGLGSWLSRRLRASEKAS